MRSEFPTGSPEAIEKTRIDKNKAAHAGKIAFAPRSMVIRSKIPLSAPEGLLLANGALSSIFMRGSGSHGRFDCRSG
jgi:hypothetical protein